MGEVGVCGYSDHLTVDILELLDSLREGDDFRRTNKGEVQGVEVDNNVLPLYKQWSGTERIAQTITL